jgi:hypothetical protein
MALALRVNTYTTGGNQLLYSVSSVQVQSDLGRAREEFYILALCLRELAPDHAIFDETAFTHEAIDKLASLGSQQSQKMHGHYKKTRNSSMSLRVCVCVCVNLTSSWGGLP